jgi:hypothetical protein
VGGSSEQRSRSRGWRRAGSRRILSSTHLSRRSIGTDVATPSLSATGPAPRDGAGLAALKQPLLAAASVVDAAAEATEAGRAGMMRPQVAAGDDG